MAVVLVRQTNGSVDWHACATADAVHPARTDGHGHGQMGGPAEKVHDIGARQIRLQRRKEKQLADIR